MTTIDRLVVNDKYDLNQVVLVPDFQDYHGRMEYSHHTVFAVINNIETFVNIINWLSNDEIVSFRDEYEGNILSGLAESGKDLRYFEYIAQRIGKDAMLDLLLQENRLGICPLAEITNLEVFVVMMNMVDIDAKTLRSLCARAHNDIVDHVASMVNSASSIEVAIKNGTIHPHQ